MLGELEACPKGRRENTKCICKFLGAFSFIPGSVSFALGVSDLALRIVSALARIRGEQCGVVPVARAGENP